MNVIILFIRAFEKQSAESEATTIYHFFFFAKKTIVYYNLQVLQQHLNTLLCNEYNIFCSRMRTKLPIFSVCYVFNYQACYTIIFCYSLYLIVIFRINNSIFRNYLISKYAISSFRQTPQRLSRQIGFVVLLD